MRKEVYEVLRKYDNGEYGKINIFAYTHSMKDEEDILVISDWESATELERIFYEIVKGESGFRKRHIDKYDTSAIDYITDERWTFSDEGFLCSKCDRWYFYDNHLMCGYANYKVYDGWIECEDCIKEEPDNYLGELINNPKNANTILDDEQLRELGFEKVNDSSYDNGWYSYNRQDDPQKILSKAQTENANAEYLFSIVKTYNPWETEFNLYKREVE